MTVWILAGSVAWLLWAWRPVRWHEKEYGQANRLPHIDGDRYVIPFSGSSWWTTYPSDRKKDAEWEYTAANRVGSALFFFCVATIALISWYYGTGQ